MKNGASRPLHVRASNTAGGISPGSPAGLHNAEGSDAEGLELGTEKKAEPCVAPGLWSDADTAPTQAADGARGLETTAADLSSTLRAIAFGTPAEADVASLVPLQRAGLVEVISAAERDDALRAVHGAAAIRERLAELPGRVEDLYHTLERATQALGRALEPFGGRVEPDPSKLPSWATRWGRCEMDKLQARIDYPRHEYWYVLKDALDQMAAHSAAILAQKPDAPRWPPLERLLGSVTGLDEASYEALRTALVAARGAERAFNDGQRQADAEFRTLQPEVATRQALERRIATFKPAGDLFVAPTQAGRQLAQLAQLASLDGRPPALSALSRGLAALDDERRRLADGEQAIAAELKRRGYFGHIDPERAAGADLAYEAATALLDVATIEMARGRRLARRLSSIRGDPLEVVDAFEAQKVMLDNRYDRHRLSTEIGTTLMGMTGLSAEQRADHWEAVGKAVFGESWDASARSPWRPTLHSSDSYHERSYAERKYDRELKAYDQRVLEQEIAAFLAVRFPDVGDVAARWTDVTRVLADERFDAAFVPVAAAYLVATQADPIAVTERFLDAFRALEQQRISSGDERLIIAVRLSTAPGDVQENVAAFAEAMEGSAASGWKNQRVAAAAFLFALGARPPETGLDPSPQPRLPVRHPSMDFSYRESWSGSSFHGYAGMARFDDGLFRHEESLRSAMDAVAVLLPAVAALTSHRSHE